MCKVKQKRPKAKIAHASRPFLKSEANWSSTRVPNYVSDALVRPIRRERERERDLDVFCPWCFHGRKSDFSHLSLRFSRAAFGYSQSLSSNFFFIIIIILQFCLGFPRGKEKWSPLVCMTKIADNSAAFVFALLGALLSPRKYSSIRKILPISTFKFCSSKFDVLKVHFLIGFSFLQRVLRQFYHTQTAPVQARWTRQRIRLPRWPVFKCRAWFTGRPGRKMPRRIWWRRPWPWVTAELIRRASRNITMNLVGWLRDRSIDWLIGGSHYAFCWLIDWLIDWLCSVDRSQSSLTVTALFLGTYSFLLLNKSLIIQAWERLWKDSIWSMESHGRIYSSRQNSPVSMARIRIIYRTTETRPCLTKCVCLIFLFQKFKFVSFHFFPSRKGTVELR